MYTYIYVHTYPIHVHTNPTEHTKMPSNRTHTHIHTYTAYCTWSVISSVSNPIGLSSSPGIFCHVPLKRDQLRLRLEIEIEQHSKCNRLYMNVYMRREVRLVS